MKTSSSDFSMKRRGPRRIYFAFLYSVAGLKAGWSESAFRQECYLALVMAPLSFWLGSNWVERALLLGSVLAVLVVELLNSAVESAIDRTGTEWNALAKRAKDMGSAAVMISLLWCVATWVDAIHHRFFS